MTIVLDKDGFVINVYEESADQVREIVEEFKRSGKKDFGRFAMCKLLVKMDVSVVRLGGTDAN